MLLFDHLKIGAGRGLGDDADANNLQFWGVIDYLARFIIPHLSDCGVDCLERLADLPLRRLAHWPSFSCISE